MTAFETLAMGDLSLLVKCGVQFGLFGGAILHLGTEAHHERYLRDVATLELPGCFAMTETGHGSNVQALETTATYDPERDELVVHTPHDDARKDYIGNAARDGRMAVVFAQLSAGGSERGVHAVLVPIRDEDGNALPGVRIEDCGAKLGLNGVDNGRIWFDHVRVPRESLLDRYARLRRGRDLLQPDREPDQALLHDARHADPGADLGFRRLDQRVQGGADDRGPAGAGAAPVRPAGRAGGAAAGLPHAPAAAAAGAGQDLRALVRPAAAGRRAATPRSRATTSARGASSRRWPRA